MGNNFRYKLELEIEGDDNSFNGKIVNENFDYGDLKYEHKVLLSNTLLHILNDYYTKFMVQHGTNNVNDLFIGLTLNGISESVHSSIGSFPGVDFSCSCENDEDGNFIAINISSNPFGLLN